MPTRATQCPHRDAVEALARGVLGGREQQHTVRHLEHCELCRTVYRNLTVGRFPRLRHYTILQELGKGGFGVVYKAVHHGKERVEALKVLFGKTAQREAYFENEVHLVAKLNHPNIATLYEAHLRAAPLYYTMEYVEGEPLGEHLRNRQRSLEERIQIIRTVADAIEYAHRAGVIHRDLKPQNIIIDAEGRPRILDFGIAKRLVLPEEDSTDAPTPASEGALGTFGYMPPEQVAGQEVDERADVFSLGALLFHVITGQPAHYASQTEHLTALLRRRDVSRAPDLAAIIGCCVQPLPERRYPSCAALIEDLDNYLAGRSIRALPHPTTAYRTARVSALMLRNYPGTIQVTLVLAATLVLATIFQAMGARWVSAGARCEQAALVAFADSTLSAVNRGEIGTDLPGFHPLQRKSWRVLYGHLMERLAHGRPRAVVWDYYFPDAQPRYDEAFVRGVQALAAPVVVGAIRMDENAEPEMAPAIRAAVHAWGTLLTKDTSYMNTELAVPLAIKRGYNPPTPSIALAGFAVARQPDCDLLVRAEPGALELNYRARQTQGNTLRWRPTDRINLFETEVAGAEHKVLGVHTGLCAGDQLYLGRFQLPVIKAWESRAITVEQVLVATDEQLRAWFEGRIVLIGEMSPRDRHPLASGETIFGCQIHAHVLEALLNEMSVYPLTRPSLAVRVALWCALAAVLVNAVRVPDNWQRRQALVLGISLLLLGMLAAALLPMRVTAPWAVEATVAGSAILAAGGLTLMIRLMHRRQLRLTPQPIWSAGESTATTALLETTEPSFSAGDGQAGRS